MPNFFYIVRDKTGRKINGVEEATNQNELITRLQAKDLIVVNVIPELNEESRGFNGKSVAKGRWRARRYRITSNDLTLFCRQLATLLNAGVTILKSLDIISSQVASRRFYNVLKKITKSMEQGLSLHEAMAKEPTVFSELWINLAESGEASGNLAVILDRLAKYLERRAEFNRKIVSALIYPVVLLVASAGALLFLTVRIIPVFAELFKGFNVTLPLLTRILVVISTLIRRFIIIIVGISIGGFFMFRKYIQTKAGRRMYEQFKFRLPLFGEFFRALVAERFSSEMTTLIEGGVPMLYSLDIAERSVGNSVMGNIIHQVKSAVQEGKPLSQPLEKSEFFEPMVVQMISIGEEIGELSQMFKRINIFYEEYTETFLTRFTALFEPIILIFMGLVIGVMVVGMFLPIFQIAKISG